MLDWSIDQSQHPVAIRVPVGPLESGRVDQTDYSQLNKNQLIQAGSKVALLGVGNALGLAKKAAAMIETELGITPTVINPRFISGLDTDTLSGLIATHQLLLTLEDGLLEGGYGQAVASYLGKAPIKIVNFGLDKAFHDRYQANELLQENGLTVDAILREVRQELSL